MARLVKIVSAATIPLGSGKLVEIEGRRLAVFNVNGHLYAIDDACPHRGGPLSEGRLEGRVVTCPWHGFRVDVTTGAVQGLSAPIGVACYALREVDGEISVEL